MAEELSLSAVIMFIMRKWKNECIFLAVCNHITVFWTGSFLWERLMQRMKLERDKKNLINSILMAIKQISSGIDFSHHL